MGCDLGLLIPPELLNPMCDTRLHVPPRDKPRPRVKVGVFSGLRQLISLLMTRMVATNARVATPFILRTSATFMRSFVPPASNLRGGGAPLLPLLHEANLDRTMQ